MTTDSTASTGSTPATFDVEAWRTQADVLDAETAAINARRRSNDQVLTDAVTRHPITRSHDLTGLRVLDIRQDDDAPTEVLFSHPNHLDCQTCELAWHGEDRLGATFTVPLNDLLTVDLVLAAEAAEHAEAAEYAARIQADRDRAADQSRLAALAARHPETFAGITLP